MLLFFSIPPSPSAYEKSSETNLSNDGFLSSFRDFNIIKLFKNSSPKNDISYTLIEPPQDHNNHFLSVKKLRHIINF